MKRTIKIQELIKVESSNIDMIGYDDNQIFVQFKGGGIYKYNKTDLDVFNEMKKSESVGKFLNTKIKNVYEFNKLEDVELTKKEQITDQKGTTK